MKQWLTGMVPILVQNKKRKKSSYNNCIGWWIHTSPIANYPRLSKSLISKAAKSGNSMLGT